ncbi:shikimate kinase [Isachenkonia alkalipeptolytica]|uniref:Shikimate kinase n=1 Tax=Isachenkonia alkalipeptolytica TaxID=2565777 RepID=A0AA44BF79_9CLOT|nr:shikimate kinase [Isachenkonia alkalipeptolytica]NBG89713.1 hypothetical protein [Isachenkonia alkalipeptolytica]
MKSIHETRNEINQLDQQVSKLLKERFLLLDKVLEYKILKEEQIENLQREKEVIENIASGSDKYDYHLKEIYHKIVEQSKSYQWHLLLKENIYIIGFMAVGKTTLGKTLSQKIQWEFLDTDLSIEEREQRKVKDIFKESGEDYFRDLEAKVIQDIHEDWIRDNDKKIIACGGGVILNPENVRTMKKNGVIVYLEGDINTIYNRISLNDSRPLLSEAKDLKRRVETLLESRQNLYREIADITLFVGEETPKELVGSLIQELEHYERKRSLSE